ncbi:MAG: DUF6576 domain-containing protein [Ilumatobacteraceae bacterium]
MSGRFSYSSPQSRYGGTPWFKVGDIDVGTAVLVAGVCVLSMFVWAIDTAALRPLVLDASAVRSGQLWRLITWPLANQPDFWQVITIAIFWYFGRELEGLLGRNRFAWFLGILTVVPAIVGAIVGLDVFGLDYLELGIFIVFIAEHPTARFFFNIPGWVIGAVIVVLQFLQLLGDRNGAGLIFLVVLLATAGLAARSFGLATELPWIPKLPMPGAGMQRSPKSQTRGSSGRTTKARGGTSVIEGPWAAPTAGPSPDAAAAQAELDVLLDKISASGLESLDADEKRRLNELSKRLR